MVVSREPVVALALDENKYSLQSLIVKSSNNIAHYALYTSNIG